MDVIVQPDKGNAAQIGKQLLDLADDPGQVQWVTWPVAGFKVPQELAESLKGVRSLPNTEQSSDEAEADKPKRRPGRPRRAAETPVQDTDDNEKEE